MEYALTKEDLEDIVQDIHEKENVHDLTPRNILIAFGCRKRTKGNLARINQYLKDKRLTTDPDFSTSYIDGFVKLKSKKKAKHKNESDPIQRIKLLTAANKIPLYVDRDAKLLEAITLMMMHNYSQLPIMNTPRTVNGFISWETIGYGLSNGVDTGLVKDYIETNIEIIDYETPLLDAVDKIIKNEFVLVKKSDKTISGIVTIADLSLQFISATEPFLLLEQIENHIRKILHGKFLIEEMSQYTNGTDANEKIEFIDDLSFGNYIRLIEKPENWTRLNLSVDRGHFISQLHKIREIRNDVMHFDPEGITQLQREDLIKMSNFLKELSKYTK